MKKSIFLSLLMFGCICADTIKIPLNESGEKDPNIKFIQQKLYVEENYINGKKEVQYNIVEFYCYNDLVVVKLPDNSIKYVGDPKTMTNLKCSDFKDWEENLDE